MVKYDPDNYSTYTHFQCKQCHHIIELQKNGGTGYALNNSNELICYSCCGENDRQRMIDNKKIVLYLVTYKDDFLKYLVINWPGTLRIPIRKVKIGKHNIAGTRTDVWFVFNGYWWHGVNYGDNSQICHCKQTKERSKLNG